MAQECAPLMGTWMLDVGAKPLSHPIRKRAWWRALNGGRLWLLIPYCAIKSVQEKINSTQMALVQSEKMTRLILCGTGYE